MTAYRVEVVEADGSGGFDVLATDNEPIFLSPVTAVLNGMGQCALQWRRDHPCYQAAMHKGDWPSREIRIFRGAATTPIWWGIPTRPTKEVGGGEIRSVVCVELMWLFTRIHFGAANAGVATVRGFEDTTFANDPWGEVGGVASIVTAANPGPIEGTKYARLDGSGGNEYVYFDLNVTAGPYGMWPIVTAWFYISIGMWVGPPAFDIGIRVTRYAGHNEGGNEAQVRQRIYYRIDSDTPRGDWLRATLGGDNDLAVPAAEAATIRVELWAVDGRIYWDAMRIITGDVFAAEPIDGTDIGEFAGMMIEHAQDTTYGKKDLQIINGATTAGAVTRIKFATEDHHNIYNNGLMALTQLENGIDIGMDLGADSRTFRTYSRVDGATGKGSNLTAQDFTPGGDWLLDWAFVGDADQGSNAVIVLGEGSGADREEGFSSAPSAMGGRVYEMIVSAPNRTRFRELRERAVRARKARQYPVQLDLQLQPGQVNTIRTGDRVHLPQLDPMLPAANFRVIDWALNPNQDRVTVGVVPLVAGT